MVSLELVPAFAGAAFDSTGGCLYHPEVKLTQKTTIDGKVVYKELRRSCPKCSANKKTEKRHTSLSGGKPRPSRPHHGVKKEENPDTGSTTSSRRPSLGKSKPLKHYDTPFDSKGRCHYHRHVQLAKKKLTGGWKVLLDICPKCIEEDYIDGECRSVTSRRSSGSGRSARSSRSIKSCRSLRSTRSGRSTGRSSRRDKFECPFDDQGYCHVHSHVRLAKKKLTGGWKILQDFCLECANEETSSVVSRSKKPSPKKMNRVEVETASEHSTSQSEEARKKIVRKMHYTDEDGEEGLYTGYVNQHYKPHGRGKIIYNNGTKYDGTWSEGTKIHGKSTSFRDASKNKGSSRVAPDKDRESEFRQPMHEKHERRDKLGPLPPNETPRSVKNMKFIDFYGDPGRYTGEVNEQRMPHGRGEMTYDHGLVQGGRWTNGLLDEGSVMSCPANPHKSSSSSVSSRNEGTPRKSTSMRVTSPNGSMRPSSRRMKDP